MPPITKVLIANRGEIAIRIARAAQVLDISSVGVYALEDELSLHSRHTDERIQLAQNPDPIAAYLNIQNVIGIAKDTSADAIHPGYGFLAENAELAAIASASTLVPSPN